MMIRLMGILCLVLTAVALASPIVGDIAVVDTHVHNSDLTKFSYTYPASFPSLNRSWTIEDFSNASTPTTQFRGIILMELEKDPNTFDSSYLEALFYQSIADRCNVKGNPPTGCVPVLGIVASCPLEEGAAAVRTYLQNVTKAAPLVKGVRDPLWKKPNSFFYNASFRAGLGVLAEFGLVLDLLIHKEQFAAAADLVAAFPNVTFNLNHLGYPDISNTTTAAFQEWSDGLAKLANHSNVHCKMSGLPQCTGGRSWASSTFVPYISKIVELFGTNRINFAGNWFVLDNFGEWPAMFSAVTGAVNSLNLSIDEKTQIYAQNAISLYKL